jgi:hypothetical protein
MKLMGELSSGKAFQTVELQSIVSYILEDVPQLNSGKGELRRFVTINPLPENVEE